MRHRSLRDGERAVGRSGRVERGGHGAPSPGVAEVPVPRRHGCGLHLPLRAVQPGAGAVERVQRACARGVAAT